MDPIAIQQGLTLSAIGLTLTFLTLGLMVLPIWVVNKYQEAHPPKPEIPAEIPGYEEPVPCTDEGELEDEGQIAAAIAVFLMANQRGAVSSSQLGSTLEVGPGRWWTRADN